MFITLVDSLQTSCPMHKFTDDTTLSEFVAKSTTNCTKACCDKLVHQSEEIRMNVNAHKTKMLIGPMAKDPPPLLSLCGATVEWVPVLKLLGVHASSDLKWTKHIDAMVSKAASHLYFLKQLRRADVPTRELLHFYTTVVRPVLEYACPVWHLGLTVAHSDLLKSVQRRAIRIIYPDANYKTSLIVAGINTFYERREVLIAKFFKTCSCQQLNTAQPTPWSTRQWHC